VPQGAHRPADPGRGALRAGEGPLRRGPGGGAGARAHHSRAGRGRGRRGGSPMRLHRGGHEAATVPVAERADALRSALDIGGDELDPGASEQARTVVGRVAERWALTGSRTVVALAGATGSGKSSLFNRLAGGEVST